MCDALCRLDEHGWRRARGDVVGEERTRKRDGDGVNDRWVGDQGSRSGRLNEERGCGERLGQSPIGRIADKRKSNFAIVRRVGGMLEEDGLVCRRLFGCSSLALVVAEFVVQVGGEDGMHGAAVDMVRCSVVMVRFRMDVE